MKVCDLQRDQDRRVTPVLEKIRGCNIRRMGAKGSQVPDARQGGHMQVSSATKNEWGIMPHSLKKEATMCDAKNTTEDGKCMDARKDECKWYLDGKCTKKEEDNGTKSEVLAKVHEDAQ